MQLATKLVPASMLRHLFGDEILESVRHQRWTLLAIVAPLLGFISDCLQVVGPFADIAFGISLLLLVVAVTIVHFNWPYCEQCKSPRVGLFIFVVTFGVVCILQWATDARKEGVLATHSPEIRQVLEQIGLRFNQLEAKLDANEDQRRKDVLETLQRIGQTQLSVAELEKYARENSIPIALLASILRNVDGWIEIEPSEVRERLELIVRNYNRLVREIETVPLSAQVQAARKRALALLEKGQIEDAASVMAEARRKLESMREQQLKEEAQLLADEAKIAAMKGDYETAARQYEMAAKLRESDPETRFGFLLDRAAMLSCPGFLSLNNAALEASARAYKELVEIAPNSEQRAGALIGLSNVMSFLGGKAIKLDTTEQALEFALRAEALQADPKNRLTALAIQHQLGSLYVNLGVRKTDPEKIRKGLHNLRAVAAAYKGTSGDQYPRILREIGMGASRLARQEYNDELFDEAVGALEMAIEAFRTCTLKCREIEIANTRAALGWTYHYRARFADIDLYLRALEEFEKAMMVLNAQNSYEWFVYAVDGSILTHLQLAELRDSSKDLNEASRYIGINGVTASRVEEPARWIINLLRIGNYNSIIGERTGTKSELRFAIELLTFVSVQPLEPIAEAELALARFRLAKLEDNAEELSTVCKGLEAAIRRIPGDFGRDYGSFRSGYLRDPVCIQNQ